MKKAILKDELLKARKWAKINLVGKKVYHKDIQKQIKFTNKGIKHVLYAKPYSLKIHLIYHAKKLLKTSTLNAIEKDKKDRDEIKAIYKLTNNFRYKKKEYMVYIVVREGQNGLIYYDHGVIKEKNLNK